MDKNAIKKYAVWARRELISRVTQRASKYGIEEKNIIDEDADSINGKLLTKDEKAERKALIAKINENGFEQVMEEVAYTWFNRFSALRFMEVNGYLPTHVRVFTDDENNFKPQILTEAIHLELDGLDMDKVYAYKERNDDDELFKYLIITQCNALNKIMPGMFQKIADYTELLFPDNLLREGSVVEQMIAMIPEEDWKDAVQIIGWLYQYYNIEPKAKVFSRPKSEKISKEDISAATQLFTPDWIVRYMVENSLGRLWLEGHPNDELESGWKYYLDEAEQEADVQAQLDKIREEYKTIKPEEIRCIDPCMGSGHILVYMFDVLMQIYEAYGYNQHEAAASIVENNLYGLDIDERAAQLAYFAVMMKARQYDRRFFSREIQPHVYAIRESNNLDKDCAGYFVNGDTILKADMQTLIDEMHDAKEYGSILDITNVDFDTMYARFDEIRNDINMHRELALNDLLPFVQVAQLMAQKYDVVVTNPPYMGSSNMDEKLSGYVKKYYPDSKADLFAVFIEKCGQMTKKYRYTAMITQHAWMFLSSFEKLRSKMLLTYTVNMAHLGARAFDDIGGEVVQTTSFVRMTTNIYDYKGTYCRLVEPTTQQGKENMFLAGENRYTAAQHNFSKIPGSPIAYWVSDNIRASYTNGILLSSVASPEQGMATADNNRFVRKWYEPLFSSISFNKGNMYKWYPYNNGGGFRKWYGLNTDVVNWENNGGAIKAFPKAYVRNERDYFKKGITWNAITSSDISVRYFGEGFIFSNAGMAVFTDEKKLKYILGFMNSKVAKCILKAISPTLNYNAGDICNLPLLLDDAVISRTNEIVDSCISITKKDWDAFEISWDFQKSPLICDERTISESYKHWLEKCKELYMSLKEAEESLNSIFIASYSLSDEITADVEDKNISIQVNTAYRYKKKKSKNDSTNDDTEIVEPIAVRLEKFKKDTICELISYAVGCMFGRYSLDTDGLAYAGGEWDASKYKTYPADADNIIPICDDEYFEDDIVGRFVKFIEVVYGKGTLDENLKFIADALGGKGSPREVIRNYFLNDFYADHCKIYQKRPIYWLFDSGKKNGFKALIYMHRYQPDTLARMRTDYVHEQQERYRTAITHLEQRINDASTAERVKLNKQLEKLKGQSDEIRTYEEKIHHLADQMIKIDLDDGVKHNYEIFKDVLAKIK